VTRALRLGAVAYLNARPLVHGLEPQNLGTREPRNHGTPEPRYPIEVRFDVPSVCAELLAAGDIDLGLIPSISYLDRPTDRVVPGISISSDGPVASVALFTRRSIRDVRTLALDTSSRTSAALTRILCVRQFQIAPSFVPHAPDLASMLAAHDAALLIGDPALFADHRALGADKIDLGSAWAELTGLPFVWAFWAGRQGAVDRAGIDRLQSARDAGVSASDRIANDYCIGDAARQAIARRYLRENMRYGLDERALRGLQAFYREAAGTGVVARDAPVSFYQELST
jgi:chorismate dehydratase